MSHTIGQVEEHNQQPNSDSLEASGEKSTSSLTDSDYEFLFNQLLEGVAHGWHHQRIAKFFKQLGERGQQHLWVSWLGRFGTKTANISSASGQQLGALMLRLGELTKSTPEIREIGTLSYQLGRKLLFGDRQDLIWEYDGPDLPLKAQSITNEITDNQDNSDLEERLPQEFAHLGTVTADRPANNTSSPSEINSPGHLAFTTPPETEVAIESELDLNSDECINSVHTPVTLEELASDTSSATEISEDSTPEISQSEPSENNILSSDLTTTEPQITTDGQAGNVNWQKFISLIEKDEELVKQIAQKLDDPDPDSQSLAQETLEKLDRLQSDTPDKSVLELVQSWFNLGLKQVSAGEFDGAVASWEKALKLNPNLSEAWHNRGSALGRLSQYEDAIESFDKALEIAPNNYQAWNDRAHALYQLQKWQEAVVSWSKAIEFMPGNHLFWYNRGCALEQLKSFNESIASYEKALEIKPDFQPARSRYIDLIADNSRTN